MSNYASLKSAIQQVIKTNGNNEITGALLQQSLLSMINSLGVGYQFVGIATPSTNPGTPDQNVFYIAGAGTYPNFNSAVIPDGYLGVFKYNGNWTIETMQVGKNYDQQIAALDNKVNGEPEYNADLIVAVTQGTGIGTGTKRTLDLPLIAGKEYTIKLTGYSGIVSSIAIYTYDENGNSVSGSWDGNAQSAYKTFSTGHFTRKFVPSSNVSKIATYLMASNAVGTGNITFNFFKEKVTGMDEIVGVLKHDVIGFDYKLDADNTTSGKYRNSTGAINTLSGYFYSNPIPVKKGDKFTANGVSSGVQSSIAMLSWVDSGNNFISLILNPSSAGTYEYVFLQDGYVCISGSNNDRAKYSVFINGISKTVPELEEEIKGMSKYVNGYDYLLESEDVTTEYYRNHLGNIITLGGYFYSKPIPVKSGDKFIAASVSSSSAQKSVAMLSWVDNSNNFISLILNPTGAGTYEYNFVKTGYVCISGTNRDRLKFKIEYASLEKTDKVLNQQIDILREEINGKYDSVRLPALTENPVEKINFNCGFVGIFKTIGIIGDSLASGEMQGYNNDGTLSYQDMYELSWGQQIAKMTGVSVFNFSQGGQYAKGWMTGNTERTWDANDVAGGAHSNKKQCYLIGFAHNDKTKVEDNTYTAGIGTTADINNSDYSQNADSFVGWYARIIQGIKSIEPRAFIFCITPPNGNYDDYSEQIRNIVEYFAGNRVYLIDLRRYGMERSNPLFVMGNHQSAAGYLYDAYEIANYMDWIIRKNANDFKYSSLVGTDILDTNPNP